MIAFDKTLLDNTFLVEEAIKLETSGFINSAELKNITSTTKTLKTHSNLLIRLCLFILGCFLYSSVCGSVSLFGLSILDSQWGILIFLFTLVGILGQEFICVKSSNFFGYGIDDAAILGAISCLAFFITELTDSNYLAISFVITVFSTLFYLRYLHIPSIIIAFIAFIATVFFSLMDYCQFGKEIMPFCLFMIGIIGYFSFKKVQKNSTTPYYNMGLKAVKSLSLLLIYFAVNYYVVRELSMLLSEEIALEAKEIPMAWLFYGFTFIIPACYLYFSIKLKDKMMLWIGLVCAAFTIFTIRFYHHLLPTEIALTLGGILLFAIAYFLIRKLKNKESGLTFLPDRFESSNSLLTFETIASASQFGIKPELKTPDSPMEFGGGGFSGGGAGESF